MLSFPLRKNDLHRAHHMYLSHHTACIKTGYLHGEGNKYFVVKIATGGFGDTNTLHTRCLLLW